MKFKDLNFSFNFRLESLSLIYLALPWIIFVIGWLKWPIAIFLTCIIIWKIYVSINEYSAGIIRSQENKPRNLGITIGIVALAILWTALSGAGGVGYQNWDWTKHNSILKDLIEIPWPPTYLWPTGGQCTPMVYYSAYYLPAALIGKIFGWAAAQCVIFIYTAAGVALGLLWFSRLVGVKPILACACFILFSGLDCLPKIIFHNNIPGGTEHLEWWWMAQYSSNSTLLFGVPQHAIGTWIATAFLISELFLNKSVSNILFIFGTTILWSPFGTVGLIPFLIMGGIFQKEKNFKLSDLVTGLLVGSLGFLYFSTHNPVIKEWLVTHENIFEIWPSLFIFYLIEFGLLGLFCSDRKICKYDKHNFVFWTAIVTLILIPLYKIGNYNDWAMRASIPGLFVLSIFVTRSLLAPTRGLSRKPLFVLFLLGAFTPLSEISRSLANYHIRFPNQTDTPSVGTYLGWALDQYTGMSNKFFFRWLARKPQSHRFNPFMYAAQNADILVEAEDYTNPTRQNFIQVCPKASWGKIVDNDFGHLPSDFLELNFSTKNDIREPEVLVWYATLSSGTVLKLSIDDQKMQTIPCRVTNDWWNFSPGIAKIEHLQPGRHTLRLWPNAHNVNIDAMTIIPKDKSFLIVEAEDYLNKDKDYLQDCPLASGGKIVDNGFGGSAKDFVNYSLSIEGPIKTGALVIFYSTSLENAKYQLTIDGNQSFLLDFKNTFGWWNFNPIQIKVKNLSAGPHQIKIQSNGVNVNLDVFYILNTNS